MELVFRDDAYARSCEATVISVGEQGIRLDRTVFYPNGGGQPGDTGVLRLPDGHQVAIADTIKGADHEDVVHVPAGNTDLPQPGDTVIAEIDWERRYRHMRMHTCMHLVCAVVDAQVTGGQVGAERSRIDFDWPDMTMTKEELTRRLNELVEADRPVRPVWITDEELASQPELVRTMSVKPPTGLGRVRLLKIEGVDLQPCGGTHVTHTGEIGRVEVAKIENKGKHNRRVNIVLPE